MTIFSAQTGRADRIERGRWWRALRGSPARGRAPGRISALRGLGIEVRGDR